MSIPRNRWTKPDGSLKFTLAERFWAQVDKRGPSECWPWTGALMTRGYGMVSRGRREPNVGAHRMAWELVNGPIPEGMEVCHRCDNPPCCNVKAHLFLGTHADNMADMKAKNRVRYGVTHGRAKLSERDVLDIRRRHGEGASHRSLARTYRVDEANIRRIISRERWRHLL